MYDNDNYKIQIRLWNPRQTMHYIDLIMSVMTSQITSLTIVYPTVYSGADQRKHQSSMPLAKVRGIHRWPVNSPPKGAVTWKMFPFNDIIMECPFWTDWRKMILLVKRCSTVVCWHYCRNVSTGHEDLTDGPYLKLLDDKSHGRWSSCFLGKARINTLRLGVHYASANWIIIASGNGLSPVRRQAIT